MKQIYKMYKEEFIKIIWKKNYTDLNIECRSLVSDIRRERMFELLL